MYTDILIPYELLRIKGKKMKLKKREKTERNARFGEEKKFGKNGFLKL